MRDTRAELDGDERAPDTHRAAKEAVARRMRPMSVVSALSPSAKLLLCDEDRRHTDALAAGLDALGHAVEVVRSHAEAFAIACAYDIDALVVAPFLRDGSALVLPSALGIRRPPLVVLVSRISERIAPPVVKRLGFDAQLTKVVDPAEIDRMLAQRSPRLSLVTTRDGEHAPDSVRGHSR